MVRKPVGHEWAWQLAFFHSIRHFQHSHSEPALHMWYPLLWLSLRNFCSRRPIWVAPMVLTPRSRWRVNSRPVTAHICCCRPLVRNTECQIWEGPWKISLPASSSLDRSVNQGPKKKKLHIELLGAEPRVKPWSPNSPGHLFLELHS